MAPWAKTTLLPNKIVSNNTKPYTVVFDANVDERNFMLTCFEINYLSGMFFNSSMCSFLAKNKYTKSRAKNETKMMSEIMGNIEIPDILWR